MKKVNTMKSPGIAKFITCGYITKSYIPQAYFGNPEFYFFLK